MFDSDSHSTEISVPAHVILLDAKNDTQTVLSDTAPSNPGADSAEELVPDILRQLTTVHATHAWHHFLCLYAPVLLQVVHLFKTDSDDASDCFLYVCQQLADKQFRRLLRFRPDGAARFSTWFRSVARNLCIDWHRSRYGRLSESAVQIRPRLEPLSGEEEGLAELLSDPGPDPEAQASAGQERTALLRAMKELPDADQLLVKLRFEQDLTLDQIARLTGLKGAQAADRRLRRIVEILRQRFHKPGEKV